MVEADRPALTVNAEETAQAPSLVTERLRLEIRKQPLRLRFYDAQGRLLSADEGPAAWAGRTAPPSPILCCLTTSTSWAWARRSAPLDKRDHKWEMWNTDARPRHLPTMDPLYESFPVYLGLWPGLGYARFFDNT